MNQIDLGGKIVVITGGAGGIGQAIAQRALASGASVCSWDNAPTAAQATAGIASMQVDITSEAAVTAAYADTIAKFGRIDVLVNSAGITGPTLTVQDYPLDAWLKVMAINLTGTFLCSRAVVGGMVQNGYGRIVNMASVAGKEGNPLQSAYSASKAAVIALTKSMGKELAKVDVRVNCIAPAMIESALLDQMPASKRAENLAKIPMGRAGTVDEIAAMALWLASEECSFTTGATFDASGGRATY
ncbi:3-oxoacyl-ACP reductase [Rhodoferax koreense]|uniref:3-oxoacyl-ACP reductase n=1 Tax=Rhodoferax koreensis TaxID=1842727 RepID=A0A1P8K3T2_9BURK|nr:SDR family NAD(P)-dependent oxidoreductase [Rhodoferax koreense]APW40674.1 3-oxoacyl-ACP reductase [Rhodoferax koreense]